MCSFVGLWSSVCCVLYAVCGAVSLLVETKLLSLF